jgi:hypothetical protein
MQMLITHKLFLSWLLYITVVIFAIIGMTFLGLPQIMIRHDHSHLSLVLLVVYVFGEIFAGVQVLSVSKQHRSLTEALKWLRENALSDVMSTDDAVVLVSQNGSHFRIAASPFANHVSALCDRAKNDPKHRIDQRILMDVLASKLERNASIGEFFASQIIWIGILATVGGVVMAFWPFMQAGVNLDAMRNNLGAFFAGIAVAFIPCTASFLFKIALNVNGRLLNEGVEETLDVATVISETHIIPYLENRS